MSSPNLSGFPYRRRRRRCWRSQNAAKLPYSPAERRNKPWKSAEKKPLGQHCRAKKKTPSHRKLGKKEQKGSKKKHHSLSNDIFHQNKHRQAQNKDPLIREPSTPPPDLNEPDLTSTISTRRRKVLWCVTPIQSTMRPLLDRKKNETVEFVPFFVARRDSAVRSARRRRRRRGSHGATVTKNEEKRE